MKVSVQLFASHHEGETAVGVVEQTVELTRLADELGFDTVWFAEHHATPWNLCGDPLTMAAYAAGVTQAIGVGTAVCNLTVQNPIAVAERAALVAHLSAGRLQLGVGRGFAAADLELFGVPKVAAAQIFDDNLDLFRAYVPQLFPEDRPLWIATTGNPRTLQFAAEHGWGLLLASPGHRLAEFQAQSQPMWQASRAGPQPVAVFRAVHVANTVEQARVQMLPYVTWYRDQAAALQPEQPPRSVDEILATFCVFGPPQHCLQELTSLAQMSGATEVVCVFGLGGAPLRLTRESMQRFAASVMPHLATVHASDSATTQTMGAQRDRTRP
ncbi:MAG: LLM class flavin-dependent oxidoreductase [Nocardioides sp.]